MYRSLVSLGAFIVAFGIVLGAFGAHALKDTLTPYQLEIFKTGTLYHLLHGMAVTVIAILALNQVVSARVAARSAGLFIFGIVAFSGSLYLLAMGGPSWLGPITPLGGTAFIAGWILLGLGALKPAGNAGTN